MEPSKVVGLAAIATAVVVGVVVTLDVKVPPEGRGDIVESRAYESKVAFLEDGGKVYRVPVRLRDGGTAYDEKTAAEAPCKRAPRGGGNCFRTYVDFTGREVTEKATELNRYPAASMTGADCVPVACSIWLGEDAEADEVRK